MKKKLALFITLFFFSGFTQSQHLVINWQQCFGGSNYDDAYDIVSCGDGYLIVGQTESNDGDISYFHGGTDIWLVGIDGSGNKIWEKTYGGSIGERGVRIFHISGSPDYLIAGFANSNDGDVSPHPYPERLHYWFIKIDSLGNILWDRVAGGNGGEWLLNATSTVNGGVAGIGYTASWEGDITNYFGWLDAWIINLNPDGSTDWDFTIGTSENQDYGEAIIQTSDGGFLAGTASSIEGVGNISCLPHSFDTEAVLFKIDSNGNEQWHRCYGGSGAEGVWDIFELNDGYILCALSMSSDGDLEGSGWHGDSDIWIIKINFYGDIIWQKCYGGSNFENAFRILQTTDGNFIVFGRTQSHDGDVSFNPSPGNYDPSIWIFKISNTGDILWEQCIGGAGAGGESLEFGVFQKSDYQYVIAGNMTYSPSFNVDCSNHVNNGRSDYWVFEFTDTTSVGIYEPLPLSSMEIIVKPNPAGQWAAFDYKLPEGETIAVITITDILGKTVEVLQICGQKGQKLWDTRQVKAGVYLYALKTAGLSKIGKLIIIK